MEADILDKNCKLHQAEKGKAVAEKALASVERIFKALEWKIEESDTSLA